MQSRYLLYIVVLAVSLVDCLAQVPDSVQRNLQLPVIQQDTLPKDSLSEPAPLHPNDPLAISDTTKIDSVKAKKPGFVRRFFKSDYPNPKKALYASLVFPAGGQIYNRRWWKAPIVWGGYAALIYAVDWNTSLYKRFKTAYKQAVNGEPHEFIPNGFDAADLKRRRGQLDKRRQSAYVGILVLHIIQTAEAFVDCHLKTFDVSDDLSFKFKPSLEQTFASQYPALGLGVAFSFGRAK
ncbi:MAG: hypothetical protein IT258_21900 [Saprospiraceae bacterium]|nr:hypothetical protein [Saprospiraceae bacterium]